MKAVQSKIPKALQKGSILNCADNSGAKKLHIVSVRGFKGKRRTNPRAGVGSLVFCRVKRGTEKVRHEKLRAVIIRQKKEYKRPNGMAISFEDNAAVVMEEDLTPKGTLIKGPVAKEAIERFKSIGKIANIVV